MDGREFEYLYASMALAPALRAFVAASLFAAVALLRKWAPAFGIMLLTAWRRHLARVRGSMAAESVERELLRSLEWLEHPQDLEPARHRHAACLVITELAENAPTLLFVHIREVFGHLWTAVRDASITTGAWASWAPPTTQR